MARRETLDALMARLGNAKAGDDLDRIGRDVRTLQRRWDAGELPNNLELAAAMIRKCRLSLTRMYRLREKRERG